MEQNLRIIFLGTPEFAVPALEKLAKSEFKPMAVFCASDKPVGRRQILTPPPIKILAQKYNLPVFQPANSRELIRQLETLNCDLIVSAAFGIILPKAALEMPRFGCLNVHPSLLPKYRGPSPIQSTILNGDIETGVTIFKMDEGIDTGPIIKSAKYEILDTELTTPELSQKLSELGAKLLIESLADWLAGKIKAKLQDDSKATYSKIIKKEDGKIDWQKPAEKLERQTRAYYPWPNAWTEIKGQKLKIIQADFSLEDGIRVYPEQSRRIGEIFLDKNKNLSVQTGQGYLILKTLQLEGGKLLEAENFLRGHQNIISQILI